MTQNTNPNSPATGEVLSFAEAVSPAHPDKIADRIAGALVDYCYQQTSTPKCAFEVLIGHGRCLVIGETSVKVPAAFVADAVARISGEAITTDYREVPQDPELAAAQVAEPRAGDNGIFFGTKLPKLHRKAKDLAVKLHETLPHDGKLVLGSDGSATICWSHASDDEIRAVLSGEKLRLTINPLGSWTGGVNVDTGVTGRKLACDFYGIGAPLGGGNMHGKDLSKADTTVNIVCHLTAKRYNQDFTCRTSIGDEKISLVGSLGARLDQNYATSVQEAREYINARGGFEKFAEWGLI